MTYIYLLGTPLGTEQIRTMSVIQQTSDASAATALASQLASISLQSNNANSLDSIQPASLFNPEDQFDLGDLSGFVEGNAGHSATSLKVDGNLFVLVKHLLQPRHGNSYG